MKNDAAVALRSLFTNACTTMYGILKELWYKEQVTKKRSKSLASSVIGGGTLFAVCESKSYMLQV